MNTQSLRPVVRAAVFVSGVCAALLVAVGGPAGAQEVAPAQTAAPQGVGQTPQPPPKRPLRNLSEALKSLYWDTDRRGPLLVVAPERSGVWMPQEEHEEIWYNRKQPEPLFAPPDPSLRAEIVGPYFGRKMIRCGGLTVLAPTEMVLLNTQLPKRPDPTAGMDRGERLRFLQASLTPAQWRTLGSPAGLGMGDLDADQRTLFDSLIPNPLRVAHGKVSEWGGVSVEMRDGKYGDTLSDAQRNSVRIRLNRAVRMQLVSTSNQQPSYYTEILTATPGEERWTLNSKDSRYTQANKYGVVLRARVPSRLKTGQIDFEAPALDVAVSITGVKTVGELITAVRTATRVELYVDPRAEKLKLWWSGGIADTPDKKVNLRAGDLLKSLAWALTGVYRKVGPDAEGKSVYILTDDIEGMGTRRTRINAWVDAGSTIQQKMRDDLNKKIREKQPMQYVSFMANDPAQPTSAGLAKVEEAWKTDKGRNIGAIVNLGEVSETMRGNVRDAINRQADLVKNNPGLRDSGTVYADRVLVTERMKMTYMIPGIGDVESDDTPWDSLNSMLPPAEKNGYDREPNPATAQWKPSPYPTTLPGDLAKGTTLCVLPKTEAEAAAAVGLARQRGMNTLWIQLADPDSEASKAILKTAIATAKPYHMPVYVVIRLMLAGGKGAPAEAQDINVLGETGAGLAARMLDGANEYNSLRENYQNSADWLRPDVPATVAILQKRLSALADTPGLEGIVLKAIAANGYTTPGSSSNYQIWGESGGDFGYTLPNRMALIRKIGCDPIDLVMREFYNANMSLPNFFNSMSEGMFLYSDESSYEPPMPGPLKAWNGIRYDKELELLKTVYQNFRAGNPGMPLLLCNPNLASNGGGSTGVLPWESADTFPDVNLSSAKPAANQAVVTPGAKPGAKPEAAPPVPAIKFVAPSWRFWISYISPLSMKYADRDPSLKEFAPLPSDSPKTFSLSLSKNLHSFYQSQNAPELKMGANTSKPKIDGLVLDMSGFSFDQATLFVREGVGAVATANR